MFTSLYLLDNTAYLQPRDTELLSDTHAMAVDNAAQRCNTIHGRPHGQWVSGQPCAGLHLRSKTHLLDSGLQLQLWLFTGHTGYTFV